MLWTLLALFCIYHLVTWGLSRIRIGNYIDKHVVITGCDRGFGNLLAKRLDGLGFKVFAACLTSEGADKLKEACSDRVTTLLLDVTDEKSIAAAQQFVESRLPAGKGLWGLVNNAGVAGVVTPSEWQSRQDWMQCLSVNLLGLIDTTRVFLPLLRQGQGRIVNMSSMMGRIVAAALPYCVSKYGVEAFSDGLRRETYGQGIKVCMIEPGYFKTPIIDHAAVVQNFQQGYDATPEAIRKPYNSLTPEKMASMMQKIRENASEDFHLVISAMELALTSQFPPTRQLVGNDARFVGRILWNLPAPLADWIMNSAKERM